MSRLVVRRVAVLLNRGAGTLRAGRVSVDDIAGSFARMGVEATIHQAAPRTLHAAAERLLAEPADALVIGGGDGTIGSIAGLVAAAGRPLGILPLGTLNHFARDLGLSTAIDGATATIAAGLVRAVDLSEVNGLCFVNNASIGLYPSLVRDRERQRELFGRDKRLAMVLATLRGVLRLTRLRVAIRGDGVELVRRTPIVFVGNNDYSLSLFDPSWRVRLDRGHLAIYIARAQTRFGLLALALRGLLGMVNVGRHLDHVCLPEVEIRVRHHHLRVALDGELHRLRTPLVFRCRPAALAVLAPA